MSFPWRVMMPPEGAVVVVVVVVIVVVEVISVYLRSNKKGLVGRWIGNVDHRRKMGGETKYT